MGLHIGHYHRGMWTQAQATESVFTAIAQLEPQCNCHLKHVVGIWHDLTLKSVHIKTVQSKGYLYCFSNITPGTPNSKAPLFLQREYYLKIIRATVFYPSLHPS